MATKRTAIRGGSDFISLADWRRLQGLEDEGEFIAFLERLDGTYPMLCRQGCEAESDGTCPHGGRSVMRAAGLV